MTVSLPARCERCGLVFDPGLLHLMPGAKGAGAFRIRTTCPRCQSAADFVEGIFSNSDRRLEVVAGPSRSFAILEAIQKAADSARDGADNEEIIEELAKISPEFAAIAAVAAKRGGKSLLFLLLAYMLTTCSSSLNWNELIDQGHVYLTRDAPYCGDWAQPTNAHAPRQTPDPSKDLGPQQTHQAKTHQRQHGRQPPERPKKPK